MLPEPSLLSCALSSFMRVCLQAQEKRVKESGLLQNLFWCLSYFLITGIKYPSESKWSLFGSRSFVVGRTQQQAGKARWQEQWLHGHTTSVVSKERVEEGLGCQDSSPTSSDVPPQTSFHLSQVPSSPQTASPAGDQLFKRTSLRLKGSVVNSTYCSCGGPRFCSQHPH